MAQQIINIGAVPGDKTGDTLRTGGQKINANFAELYTKVANTFIPAQAGNANRALYTDGATVTWRDVKTLTNQNFIVTLDEFGALVVPTHSQYTKGYVTSLNPIVDLVSTQAAGGAGVNWFIPAGVTTTASPNDAINSKAYANSAGVWLKATTANNTYSVNLNTSGQLSLPSYTLPNSAGTTGQVLTWPGSGTTLVWSTVTYGSTPANYVLAAPSGSAGTPTFRALVTEDLLSGTFHGYDYEIHVSGVDGNDTTGNGNFLNPVATITKALTLVTAGLRRTIVIHSGTYNESPSITVQSTCLNTFSPLGGTTYITGTLSTSVGCTIAGLQIANLNITTPSGVGDPHVIDCTITGTLTKSGSAVYTEIQHCDINTACNITGAGLVNIVNPNLNFLTVNNASAVVTVRAAKSCKAPVLTAGTLNIVDSAVQASVTNAVTSAAGSILTLANSQFLNSASNNVAPLVLNGFYSILNCVYDRPNSTLVALSGTGGSTSSIDYFQYINADRLVTSNTSFDLINTTATTLNIGGAATTLAIGASSGTTTIAGRTSTTNLSRSGLLIEPANYIAVASTATYALSTTVTDNVLVVSTTALTATLTFPSSGLVDGQRLKFTVTTNTVTLALTAGPTLVGTFAGSVTAPTTFTYVYRTSNTTWYRV
jgi:hypothetical protein